MLVPAAVRERVEQAELDEVRVAGEHRDVHAARPRMDPERVRAGCRGHCRSLPDAGGGSGRSGRGGHPRVGCRYGVRVLEDPAPLIPEHPSTPPAPYDPASLPRFPAADDQPVRTLVLQALAAHGLQPRIDEDGDVGVVLAEQMLFVRCVDAQPPLARVFGQWVLDTAGGDELTWLRAANAVTGALNLRATGWDWLRSRSTWRCGWGPPGAPVIWRGRSRPAVIRWTPLTPCTPGARPVNQLRQRRRGTKPSTVRIESTAASG